MANTSGTRGGRGAKKVYEEEEDDNESYMDLSDDDSSDENTPQRKRSANGSGKRKRGDASDGDYEGETPKSRRGGRQSTASSAKSTPAKRKTIKQSDDEEEEDFDEDEEEDEEEGGEISDGEDENTEPNVSESIDYKNEEWFDTASKTCSHCKKKFDTCREASLCTTDTHKRLRCYLCFNFYRNTNTLFKHYDSNHKLGKSLKCKDRYLICPFCPTNIPYKSLSCHVITCHIAPKEAKERGEEFPAPTKQTFSKSPRSGGRRSGGRGKEEESEGEESEESEGTFVEDDDEENEEEETDDDDDELEA